MAKTKSIDGNDLSASDFAYVGDENDPTTWHLPIHDRLAVRAALDLFDSATEIPDSAKVRVAMRLLAAAKKYSIDASRFASEHGMTAGWNAAYSAGLLEAGALFPGDTLAQHRAAECAANRWLRGKSMACSRKSSSPGAEVGNAFRTDQTVLQLPGNAKASFDFL